MRACLFVLVTERGWHLCMFRMMRTATAFPLMKTTASTLLLAAELLVHVIHLIREWRLFNPILRRGYSSNSTESTHRELTLTKVVEIDRAEVLVQRLVELIGLHLSWLLRSLMIV